MPQSKKTTETLSEGTVNPMAETQKTEVLWTLIRAELKTRLGGPAFDRWFLRSRLVAADGNVVRLAVGSEIQQLFIEENLRDLIEEILSGYFEGKPKAVFSVDRSLEGEVPAAKEVKEEGMNGAAGHEGKNGMPKKTNLRQSGSAKPGPQYALNELAEDTVEEGESVESERFTFDNFVVGDNCQMAVAAALAVAEKPARTYNPLYLFSDSGLGKTHLLKAIKNEVLRLRPKAKVLYVPSEVFLNEFIEGLRNNALVKFRKKYRKADFLLIDDIQFLANKDAMQEEFFHTFNSLTDAHKQIVLSSDKSPSELKGLEERMISRLEWGMTAEIYAPGMETRIAILQRKMDDMVVRLEDSVVEYIAERITRNVRRMEGALLRAASFKSMNGVDPSADELAHILDDLLQDELGKKATVDDIQKQVAEHFDLRIADLTGIRRPANIALARQIAMYLARELTDNSLKEIGEAFGGRDHGTVLHAWRKIRGRLDTDSNIKSKVSFLRRRLQKSGA